MNSSSLPLPDATFDTASDIQATIAKLFIYPVKSCAGIEMTDVVLYDTGLDYDRAWMVVDAEGVFTTQREQPRMALVTPQFKRGELILRAPGMLALHVNIDAVEAATQVEVWDDKMPAFDMGDTAAQWFTDFFSMTAAGLPGANAPKYRLVRFDPEHNRLASKKWTGGVDAPYQFADGFPLLVTSTASLESLNAKLMAAGHAAVGSERFRPNIVLQGLEAHDEDRLQNFRIAAADETGEVIVSLVPCKPCARCSIPNVNPTTGVASPEVNDTLQAYRANAQMDGAITFGMNAIIQSGVGATLRVGQKVSGNFKFD
jgi:uncharacterized protein